MRTVIITSGGDWTDAGFDVLEVPDGMDLAAEARAHRDWYKQEYLPAPVGTIKYLSFAQWLKAKRGATDSKIEVFAEH